MKIVLFGYGKMGKAIEEIAVARGHEIFLRVDQDNRESLKPHDLAAADCIIEFTAPHAAMENYRFCIASGVPVVTGTTGWTDQLATVREMVESSGTAFIYGSNFSLGVNIFFHINKILASVMLEYDYTVRVEEVHHTAKLDSPSGTAISLARQILGQNEKYTEWEEVKEGKELAKNMIPIQAYREENVPGTHTVSYNSDIDRIEIKHIAHNRKGFALGAVLAAEWIRGRQGFYEVTEMFDFPYV